MKHEGWADDRLSPAEWSDLEAYESLLRTKAIPRGMIAEGDDRNLFDRHIRDALRGARLIPADSLVCDLGSGAGLPGVPIAIVRPDIGVTLAEPRRQRAAFLELVVDELGLPNASVHPSTAESLTSRFDVCLARGFADTGRTWSVARVLLRPGGRLLYWAGRSFDPSDVPDGVRCEAIREPGLESGGPIAIMTRQ